MAGCWSLEGSSLWSRREDCGRAPAQTTPMYISPFLIRCPTSEWRGEAAVLLSASRARSVSVFTSAASAARTPR